MPLLPGAALVTALEIASSLLSPTSPEAPTSPGPDLAFPAAVWLAVPVGLLASARVGVTLTPSAVLVHDLRRGAIRWADVQDIRVESHMRVRQVVIHAPDGRLIRLRAPVTGCVYRDPAFEERFRTIGEWWVRHRGPGWSPGRGDATELPPPAGPAPPLRNE